MITMRSLLPESLTAACTDLYSQSSYRARLIRFILRALRLPYSVFGWLGRSRKPLRFACLIDASARSSELPLHTTRTSPEPFPVTADLSERASGTSPPAGGE